MKVVFVIDSISELNNKINLLKMKYGDNILFVVRADLVELFKTYGYIPNAVYYKNLTKIIHTLLINSNELEDIVICYASLKLDNTLLTRFTNSIGNKTKIISVMPKYNTFEKVCNSVYNVYVNSIFKAKDSMISPKLQFIPKDFLPELLSTHLGNRLFKINPEVSHSIEIENAETNDSLKVKSSALKFNLLACIIALLITVGLLSSIAYYKVSYIIILVCSVLYVLDILLTIIFLCKSKFDNRFLK